jgi:hypothetical protein
MANTRPSSSSTQTFLVAGAVVLAALGIYLNLGSNSGDGGGADNGTAASPSTGAGRAASRARPRDAAEGVRRLRISPERLDLGSVSQCGPRGAYEIVLSNDGTVPVTVVGWVATSSSIRPGIAPNAVIAPGGLLKVPLEVDPLGLGPKSHRLDFRLDGNARGGSVRIDYEIVSPIVPMPVLVVRPERLETKIVDLERVVDPEQQAPAGKFAVTAFEPPVARVVGSAGDGHVAIEIDFKAIDALAADNPGSPLFDWEQRGETRRWKAFDLEIATDSEDCPSLRLRVRNK